MKRIWYLFIFPCILLMGGEKAENNWTISRKGDLIRIQAGILDQELICSKNTPVISKLLVNGNNLVRNSNAEIALTFWKALPNAQPQGIDYSSESGVDQTDAVKNQTDALAVEKKKSKEAQNVQWIDSVSLSRETFGNVFTTYTYQVTEPKPGTKRLMLAFLSDKALKGISVEINYEIYKGYPVIRKWVRISNQGSQWMKVSGLMLEQLDFCTTYSRTTLLTPDSRGIAPSIIAFSDTSASSGVISANEIPSKLRHLSVDGTSGYNPDYFEWIIGPGESFTSEPVFLYAFSGKSYPTVSAVSTALDRCVEGEFHTFMNDHILRPVNQNINIAPVFCSWTNYSADINDSNMRAAADVASRIGFRCFQLDAGWSDAGPDGGWSVSTPNPDPERFPDLKGLSNYIRSRNMKTGLWYSVFINEKKAGKPGNEPMLFSLPLIRRSGGLGLSMCYDKAREKYVNDVVYLSKTYQVEYFKQDLSNICYGDIARGHESRTIKESYLRGLRGLFAMEDEIHRQAPGVWLQLSHEIYWETPGPEADIALLEHVDSYHSAPNEYWGAGNRSKRVSPSWNFNVDSLKQKLIRGAFRARNLLYAHRGLPLDRVEVFGAVTTNFKGSLTPEIQDRQVCSWLMGAPISYSGDLGSLTGENINRYYDRFMMLEDLQKKYGIYSRFQFSGVPAPTDQGWHWWGKLNADGCGVVVVLRGSAGPCTQKVNIPWVKDGPRYHVKGLFSGTNLGVFTAKQLINGELTLSLPCYGQEIIEISR